MPPGDRQIALKRLFWIHIPKTGTSLGNTLFRYACPRLPAGVTLDSLGDPGFVMQLERGKAVRGTKMRRMLAVYPPKEYCPADAFAKLANYTAIAGHVPLRSSLADSGRGVAMFRSPVFRLVSAFHYHVRSLSELRGLRTTPPPNVTRNAPTLSLQHACPLTQSGL